MKVQILGTGCPKCKLLEQHAREAVAELVLKFCLFCEILSRKMYVSYAVHESLHEM